MLLDLIKLKEKHNMNITGVIHIGAHYGEENKVYNDLNIQNRIFFEPLTSNFEVLQHAVGNDYTLIKKALGNDNKKINMYVEKANNGQSSSILKPVLHLQQYPSIVFDEVEEVEMSRLDDCNLDLSQYNFINIDVQGYELEVFKGAVTKLSSVEYIMTEVNRAEVYQDCAQVSELINFLSPYGFKLVEVDWAGYTWGDGLFIKS